MALNLVGWNVVLDSDHADELSAFYEKLLGWTRFKGEEYTVLVNLEAADGASGFSRPGCGRGREICLGVRRKPIGVPI